MIVDALNLRLHATEQEAEASTGKFPVAAKDLSAGAKELFPQLVTAGVHKEVFGASECEFPGGAKESGTVEIAHGLGVAAFTVSFAIYYLLGNEGVLAQIKEKTATKLKVSLFDTQGAPAGGVKIKFDWRAIS